MKMPSRMCIRRERGMSLLVALIFLVIMAMVGVTVAKVTSLQEHMAGNTRNRDLALQAAEAALREAELTIKNDATARADAAAKPVVPSRGNDSTFWETCFAGTAAPCDARYTLSGATAMPSSGEAGAVAAQPEYVIESQSADVYRVTARAVGGTADSVVILQAEFGYTAP